MNHEGRAGRFEVSINCRGMGEDWRRHVAILLQRMAHILLTSAQESDGIFDGRSQIGRWNYRAPREPAPPTGRAAP